MHKKIKKYNGKMYWMFNVSFVRVNAFLKPLSLTFEDNPDWFFESFNMLFQIVQFYHQLIETFPFFVVRTISCENNKPLKLSSSTAPGMTNNNRHCSWSEREFFWFILRLTLIHPSIYPPNSHFWTHSQRRPFPESTFVLLRCKFVPESTVEDLVTAAVYGPESRKILSMGDFFPWMEQ